MDHSDFENFDFDRAAEEIRALGDARANSSVFADAICALYFKAKNADYSAELLERCLGAPDQIEAKTNGDRVLQYNWVGFQSIQSRTRFVVVGSKVVGVENENAA